MKLTMYKKVEPNEEFWTQHWGKEDLERLLGVAKKSYLTKILLKHLPQEGKILEAGCGLGQYVVLFNQLGYHVEGVDYSKFSIEMCKKRYPSVRIRVMDVRNLDYKKNTFAAYISLGVIEHFENERERDAILSEANRVLAKNGILMISVPYLNFVRYLFYPLLKVYGYLKKKRGSKFYCYCYSIDKIKKILNQNGFETKIVYPLYPGKWFQKFLRKNRGKRKKEGKSRKKSTCVQKLCTKLLYSKACLNMFSHMVLIVATKRRNMCLEGWEWKCRFSA